MNDGSEATGNSSKLKRDFSEYLAGLQSEFIKMVGDRFEMGQKKYGAYTWLELDMFEMALEELADLNNYTVFAAVKIMMLRDMLMEQLTAAGQPALGNEGFKPNDPGKE